MKASEGRDATRSRHSSTESDGTAAPCRLAWTRPDFKTAQEWLRAARLNIAEGREPFAPVTSDELRLAAEHFPDRFRRSWNPGARRLAERGLPAELGQPVEPFSQQWREKFFATLEADPAFCRAVRLKLEGAL